jgi:NET1-associated nuclear protein 1 (U3 small nucleolar RNA-associated protein 17)
VRTRFVILALLSWPGKDDFAVVHESTTSADSQSPTSTFFSFYTPSSSEPLQRRSVPFRIRQSIAWQTSESTAQSIVAITHQGGLVHIGDDPIQYKEEGDAPLAIAPLAEGSSQPALFQDIFGKSAVLALPSTTEDLRDIVATPSSQKLDWELLDGPSHLLPPMRHLFSPLIHSMLKASLSVSPQSRVEPTVHEDDMVVDTHDSMNVDPVEDPADGRPITSREINSLVGFFQDPTFTSKPLSVLNFLQTDGPQQPDRYPMSQLIPLSSPHLNLVILPMVRPKPTACQ